MQRKIFHLEYKHKAGMGKHKYYTTLSQLCRFNPLIGVGYETLKRKAWTEAYENKNVIIHPGELIDKTAPHPKEGG